MKKILLLNLPYKNKKLQRDFSCPHTSKANYYWPAIDLVVYSAILSYQDLYFIDAVQEKLSEKKLIEKISEIRPEYVFTMISSISLENDIRIIKEIKKVNNPIVCASGDLASFEPTMLEKNEEIDFVISDFVESKGIRKIIEGKQKEKIIMVGNAKEIEIGIPKHELFKKYNYKLPYSFYQPVTSLMTNYGCPYGCKFCNSNNLKFKFRKLDEIISELKYIEEIGIKEVYIRDFTFGIPQIKKLLEAMINEKINIKWSCEFRADLANEEILNLMRKAGCYLIFYGGESGNQKTLDLMNKGFSINQLRNAIDLTKKAGIETLVSFIIGFESEAREDVINTQKTIMEMDPDYISVNVLVPRIGSDFRKDTNSEEDKKLDSSYEKGIRYPDGKYALDYKKEIEKQFFFRPNKITRYFLHSIKTKNRFKNFVQSGISILSRLANFY